MKIIISYSLLATLARAQFESNDIKTQLESLQRRSEAALICTTDRVCLGDTCTSDSNCGSFLHCILAKCQRPSVFQLAPLPRIAIRPPNPTARPSPPAARPVITPPAAPTVPKAPVPPPKITMTPIKLSSPAAQPEPARPVRLPPPPPPPIKVPSPPPVAPSPPPPIKAPSPPPVAPSQPPVSTPQSPAPTSPNTALVIQGALNVAEVTHFDDDEYECGEWSYRAKNAIKAGIKFAATNWELVSPNFDPPFRIKCGGPNYLCARALPSGDEYVIIDWCDPNNQCSQANKNHLDILVRTEDPTGTDCVAGCEPYTSFLQASSWELIECSQNYNANEYDAESGSQSGTNSHRKLPLKKSI